MRPIALALCALCLSQPALAASLIADQGFEAEASTAGISIDGETTTAWQMVAPAAGQSMKIDADLGGKTSIPFPLRADQNAIHMSAAMLYRYVAAKSSWVRLVREMRDGPYEHKAADEDDATDDGPRTNFVKAEASANGLGWQQFLHRVTSTAKSNSRNNLRLDATTIPELASWAFMVVGFTLAGTILRRRYTIQI